MALLCFNWKWTLWTSDIGHRRALSFWFLFESNEKLCIVPPHRHRICEFELLFQCTWFCLGDFVAELGEGGGALCIYIYRYTYIYIYIFILVCFLVVSPPKGWVPRKIGVSFSFPLQTYLTGTRQKNNNAAPGRRTCSASSCWGPTKTAAQSATRPGRRPSY